MRILVLGGDGRLGRPTAASASGSTCSSRPWPGASPTGATVR